MFVVEWIGRRKNVCLPVSKSGVVNGLVYVFVIVQILVFGAFNEVFIYLQF